MPLTGRRNDDFTKGVILMWHLITWIVLGFIGGGVACRVLGGRKIGSFFDIVLGIVGAMVGGWIIQLIGGAGVTGFNPWSVIVAILGSILVLWLAHKAGGVAK